MKRILILAALLAGCGSHAGGAVVAAEEIRTMKPDVYKDRATGCEYLATVHDGALTPRIAADGRTHMGCKAVAP